MRTFLMFTAIALSGCATGVGNQTLQIDTRSGGRAVAGAICKVNFGREGFTVTTPATLQTGSVQGDLQVVCNKPGYRTSELYYRRAQGGGGYGGFGGSNVGVGVGGGSGGVGLGVGLNFPIQMGSRSDYPPNLTIELTPE